MEVLKKKKIGVFFFLKARKYWKIIKFRAEETFGVRQAANINEVLTVESDDRLLCMHFAPLPCQVRVLFHQSASQMERAHSQWVIWGMMGTGTMVKGRARGREPNGG